MHPVEREAFGELVTAAVANLPANFRERIDNVSFRVEERATAADASLDGTEAGGTLVGVYRGIPLPHRNSGYNLVPPDVIVIFQQPLQRIARDADHLAVLVEHTVRHEVAHYFGISDERLHELGAY